ncbi:MAG: RNA methyltransferase [Chloroflexota bacterium]|jgi:RNA methyltransferase, TrmH family
MSTITSLQNARVKRVIKLNNRRDRDEARHTPVEGVREVAAALRNDVVPVEAYLCPELIDGLEAEKAAGQLVTMGESGLSDVFYVTPEVFAKMAYRGESGGLLLVIPYLTRTLAQVSFRAEPFLLIIEEAEKPGNLGAILRTADAAGVDAVIVPTATGATGTDLNNPNVIRASMGAAFTVPLVSMPAEELIGWLSQAGIGIIAASPAAETFYTDTDLTGPVALAVGSEAWGLSETMLAAADRTVCIPMAGQIDSLNLAASAALLSYEVVRQRGIAR